MQVKQLLLQRSQDKLRLRNLVDAQVEHAFVPPAVQVTQVESHAKQVFKDDK